MTKKVFKVTGMKCIHCEAHVEEAVNALPGVNGAKADREACNLTVEVDEVCVSDNQIQEVVNALGRYELEIL